MRSKHICLAALLPLQFWGVTQAQELLTLQEAVRLALQNNYDIRISANNLEINRNDVTLGNAGFLPVVGAEFSNTNSIENTRQDRTDGTVREGNGVKSSGTRYGVALDWTVFNGFKMFTRYEQLKTLRDLGEENLRLAMLTQTADVVTLYYDLAQQQQQLQSYDTILAISRLRVNLAQARFEIGRASRLEVLNARVDYNTDTTNLALAARNLEITLDKFRLGSISTVEFRTAQVNYINAVTRLNTARYEAKLAEIFLREISGTLVLE